jgi:hypothetical protein
MLAFKFSHFMAFDGCGGEMLGESEREREKRGGACVYLCSEQYLFIYVNTCELSMGKRTLEAVNERESAS